MLQALRAVEHHLGLEKLYVLGTNCVDNGPRQGLQKFLKAASHDPSTVQHYEFMQVSKGSFFLCTVSSAQSGSQGMPGMPGVADVQTSFFVRT